MSAYVLRPRSPTEIIDAAFEIVRREYLTLVTIMAVIHLPVLALQLLLGIDYTTPGKLPQNFMAQGGLSLLSMVALGLSTAAIIAAVSDAYLGGTASVGRSLARMSRRIFTIPFAATLRFIVSYICLLFIFFPGFYLYSRWATLQAVIVIEDRGPFSGFGRAWTLAEGRVGESFVTLLIAYLLFMAVWFLWYGGMILVSTTVPALAGSGFLAAAQLIPVILVYPFVGTITTLMYYDLRVRKEAFDLELMAGELSAPAVTE